MGQNGLNWICTHGAVSQHVVREIEEKLSVTFPEDYKHFAMMNNGGHPTLEAYDFDSRIEAVFNRFLSFHPDRPSYIIQVVHDIRDRLMDGVIPFANDPFGNQLCFDYRISKENPSIVFGNHELAFEDPYKGIFSVCGSFSELLSKLYD